MGNHIPRQFLISLILLFLVVAVNSSIGADAATSLRVFEEKERMAMLKAYHTRMNKERPIPLSDLKEWEKRKALLTQRVMEGFGLDPLPPRLPLDLTYGTSIEREDCTISRVYFQTFPGFYATAFLYMPKNIEFPVPGILHPHGHWASWSADDIVQSRCIGLARRGYVSLVIQYEHFDDLAIGLTKRGVFLWNNIRGLDVLESLPQVDRNRLGVTGASGGGMQSMDVAAMDLRIKAAAIAVFPTYYQNILYPHAYGCCYYSPLDALRYMDQHELIGMIAPRPACVFTVTGDWTAASIDKELKEVSSVYDLFTTNSSPVVDKPEGQQPHRLLTSRNGLFLAERWEGPHDYTKAMRERMYWWMDWWLKDKHEKSPAPEESLKLEPTANLQQLRWNRPKGHQWSDANLGTVMRPFVRFKQPFFKNRRDFELYTQKLKSTLIDLLGEKGFTYEKTRESASLGKQTIGDWEIEKIWYASEPDIRIPAFLIRPVGDKTKGRKVSIVVAANGKNDVLLEPLRPKIQKMLNEGRVVLALDQRLRGEWAYAMSDPGTVPEIIWRGNVLVWGRPELGMAVCDIRSGVDYLAARKDCSLEALRVEGYGQAAGFSALLAFLLDERLIECTSDLDHSDFSLSGQAPVLARILKYGDVGEIASLAAPRKLTLLNVNPRTSLATGESAYKLLNASRRLLVERLEEGGQHEAPLINGGFEEGAKGWQCQDGTRPTISTDRLDLGTACLRLLPGQSAISDPVPVKALRDSRLILHLSKPWGVPFEVFLLRGTERFKLVSDYEDRMNLEERSCDFLTRPDEESLRIMFSLPSIKSDNGQTLIDTVRLVQGEAVPLVKPDGRELLVLDNYARMPIDTTISRKRSQETCFIPYGPESTNRVCALGDKNQRVLYLKSGPGTYVACSTPTREPLKRGGLYRFMVTLRGKGSLTLNFWDIPNYLSPYLLTELAEGGKAFTLDFFVESKQQVTALPTVSITGEGWIEQISLKLVEKG